MYHALIAEQLASLLCLTARDRSVIRDFKVKGMMHVVGRRTYPISITHRWYAVSWRDLISRDARMRTEVVLFYARLNAGGTAWEMIPLSEVMAAIEEERREADE